MNEDVIENIRSRVERCRRLAGMITDKQAIQILLQMAREGDLDIEQMKNGEGAPKTDKGSTTS